jgi:putative transcriptional regulator
MPANAANNNYLTGKLLLAMPEMGDSRFHKAVVLVCAHDANGAMGVVINHTNDDVEFGDLLHQLEIEAEPGQKLDIPVLTGGPVENSRGFVLHPAEHSQQDSIRIDDRLAITGTVDMLKTIARGDGPQNMLFILGYAGWDAGQLDQEIQHNAWLVLDYDEALIFQTPANRKWNTAIARLGIDPSMLSGVAGNA